MKNLAIELLRPNDTRSYYLFKLSTEKELKKNNFQLQHRLKFKQVVYGGTFSYFHEEMNFSHCIEKGYKIVTDNRNGK